MLRLRKFMFDRVYLGPDARSEHERVQRTLTALFDHFLAHPGEIPGPDPGGEPLQRVVDYVAGHDRPLLHRDLPPDRPPGGVAAVRTGRP